MICSKCKKEVPNTKSICPHCKSLLVADNSSKKKQGFKDELVIKNKFVNSGAAFLVGGAVTSDKGSSVSLNKRPKKNKEVKRSDFVNYIDYQEAKAKNEYESHKEVSSKDLSAKVFNANKVKRSPLISLGLLKYDTHVQAKDVGSNLTKKYKNPVMKGGISSKGKLIAVEFVGRKKTTSSLDFIYYIVIATIWIVAIGIILNMSGVDYYFDENNGIIHDNGSSADYTIYEGTSKSGQESITISDGVTKIIYDKQYLKKFTLRSINDVYAAIEADSKKQKTECPTNIINIENQIINSYGVKAVNLCEMDEDFAVEIKNVVGYIYNHYPSARYYLTNITLANVEGNSTYIAAFMPIFTFVTSSTSSGYPVGTKTQIVLNAKYFLNSAKISNSASYGSRSGYFPPNATRSSTVAHEFGHYLSYIALLNYYDSGKLNYVTTGQASKLYSVYDDFNAGTFSRMLIEEAYDEYKKVYGNDMSFYEFRASISRYAISKDSNGDYVYDETIAEAFHDYYLNGVKAKPASRMIMKVLETKL